MRPVTFKLKVLTPLFMGGADLTGQPELRAASIRGAMRFWFRAMAGTVTTDPREIYRLESEIFGNTERKSKVVVRVAYTRPHVSSSLLILPGDPSKDKRIKPLPPSLAYLANMGLVKYFGRNELPNDSDKPRRGFYWSRSGFSRNFKFYIHIYSNSPEIFRIAKNILIITTYLGGFGARWRHGFGSCEIVEINGKSINGFDFSIIYETIAQIKEFAKRLGLITKPVENLPEFPSFARSYHQIWEGERTNEKNWDSLLSYIGKTYREFRINDGDNNHFGHTRDFLDIIQPIFEKRDIKSANPRNDVFGLPVQFSKVYKKHQRGREIKERKTAIINVFEKDINRRASPLILHVEPEKGLIRASLFKSKFMPDKANYTIDKLSSFKLAKPNENDFQRIERFLQSLGLTRRYPNA